ncbi:DSBA oxidoreductase [Paenibacillus glycanilyticus]|uniref:DSBA oxidoreductase n=1 Tax=Paenibacillus glycanilyticus TaxID=126569 RepID=A0ABQ6NQT3_9BACL|nr:DsbA family oxidoreductase [Paenibacillus glycanilyticus]GMK47458.1 DSBA oxidoreductase [Paenibacillus glycanilyticus]
MKVEVWTDMICPFCYIGKRRLEAGIEKLANPQAVEIVYRSFEMNPNMEINPLDDVYGIAASRNGSTREYMKSLLAEISRRAEQDGLKFNYDSAKMTNTFNAHRLLQYAKQFGKADELMERLYRAYFTDSMHIGDVSTLIDLAVQTGLDAANTAEMLESNRFSEEVREDEAAAKKAGLQGVPYFVINDRYAINGAQPAEVFIQTLQQAWSEEYPIVHWPSSDDRESSLCEDGFCSVPQTEKL